MTASSATPGRPDPDESGGQGAALQRLARWQSAGGLWRVVSRAGGQVTITLHSCDGGEEMARFTSGDPELRRFLGDRRSSED